MRLWLLCVALAGCGQDRVVPLRNWTLRFDGHSEEVTLPTRLSLPDRPLDYTLSTVVTLPAELRGQPLTFALPVLRAIATLRVGGRLAAPLETWPDARYSVPSRQAWRVPAQPDDTLLLELEVRHSSVFSDWLPTVPRLSATPFGDSDYLRVRSFNEATVIALLGIGGLISFIYMVSFLFDRRRTEHLWMSLQTFGAVILGLVHLCVTQPLLGTYDMTLVGVTTVFSDLAGIYFTRAHFRAGPPSRFIPISFALLALSVGLQPDPFSGARFGMVVHAVAGVIMTLDVLSVLVRQLRGPMRVDAQLMLGGWLLFWILITPNLIVMNGPGSLGSRGFHFVPLSLCVLFLTQSVVLSRERILSFRGLEARAREVQLLNDELRRQIGDRARQLADALSHATPARELSAGVLVEDRYRVIGRLGAGGMGTVYEVERISDGKRLALKVLSGVADREALARFAREAQIAAQLDHPNVVSVLDVDVSRSGMLFLVMELVAGPTLAGARPKFGDAKWALPILRQIAAALSAMHARGIVHRDLKPANVLLDGTTAKVADFGIASLAREDPGGDSTLSVGLTRTGAFMGTPMYMAPELVRGAREATPAADMFALGVVAYEMLSGKAPFAEPPILARMQGRPLVAPPPLDGADWVMRCLSFDPTARPAANEIM